MKHSSYDQRPTAMSNSQRGLALMVALIALAAMTLAGIALVRTIDTNALIAGNLAFRQNATTGADAGVEEARNWIVNTATTAQLQTGDGAGYYATMMNTGAGIDITGGRTQTTDDNVKWTDFNGNVEVGGHAAKCMPFDASKNINRICYVIHRMCGFEGALEDSASNCHLISTSSPEGGSLGGIGGGMTYQPPLPSAGLIMGYYRISVRVSGPRNNNSYVQVFVQR